MKYIIKRTITTINQIIKSPDSSLHDYKHRLKSILDHFEQLQLYDSRQDDHIELFCRLLKRLLANNNNNDSFSFEFRIEIRNDVLYLLGKEDCRESFFKQIELERELKQRKLKFMEKSKDRKTLQEILNENKQFFEIYLQNCILFHSKLQVFNLIDDMKQFFEDFNINMENLNNLEEKLNCINIDYDFSDQILYTIENNSAFRHNIADINSYQPSQDQLNIGETKSSLNIINLLKKHRWIVILGDPGNSKTTLLRWITYKFAKELKNRIPILIRIGEFATWLQQNQGKALIDYIGEHTWFSKEYCSQDEKDREILKELIYQGHALILLDGLDEISDVGQIGEIVHCIENFIKEFVLSSDFISAFDEKFFDNKIIETQQPEKSIGNQILITSRIVNYKFSLIKGPFIHHCLLTLIEYNDAKSIVYKWTKEILYSIKNILNEEKIKLTEIKIKQISQKQNDFIKRIFRDKFQLLRSNSSLLFLICKLIFQSKQIFTLNRRTDIYRHTIEKELCSWSKYNSTISKDIINSFLAELALYLHLHSSSGLIDGFNLEQLCCLSLKQKHIPQYHVQSIINWLKSNIGIAKEQALNVYSFLHLSFQEYFVAMGLVETHSSIENMAQRIISFTIHPRFRESLLIAMSLISSKLSIEDYDKFYQSLFIIDTNRYKIPFGILLFFDSKHELNKLPTESILFKALNELFHHSCYTLTKKYFISNLIKLPEHHIENWIQLKVQNKQSLKKFCKLFLNEYDTYSNVSFSNKYTRSIMYKTLRLIINEENFFEKFFIDQILRRTFRISYQRNFALDDKYQLTIHPLVLSILYGISSEMEFFLQHENINLENIFFNSSISDLINLHQSNSFTFEDLIKELKDKLKNSSITDTSIDIIEAFIELICLQGVSQPNDYKIYGQYKAFPIALDRMKQAWFYCKQFFIHHSTEKSFELINTQTKSIMNTFSSSSKSFTIACVSAWKKIGIYESMKQHDCIQLPCRKSVGIYRETKRFDNILLSFLPQSIQKLFYNNKLPLVVFLSQCLINLEYGNEKNDYFILAFPLLSKLLQDTKLTNYALVIFREKYVQNASLIREKLNIPRLFDDFVKYAFKNYDLSIGNERENIRQSKNDEQLFAALICLARLFQVQHRICQGEIYSSIKNLSDPILRILAMSIVSEMKDPLIFDEEQRDNLRIEIISILEDLLPKNSIIISSFLFVQCHTIRQFYPERFKKMSNVIGRKLIEHETCPEQEAAYIALKHLKNSDLLPYLFEFERQTENLSDLLHFNSPIFYQYLIETKTDSSNSLLALMYFVELAFDCQILRMYTEIEQNNSLDLEQIWKDSSKTEKIMTSKAAIWIDNYLQISNKQENIEQILNDVSKCHQIERKALSVVHKWLEYRNNKNLQFFSHYAALQLVIHDTVTHDLAIIISEMIVTKQNLLNNNLFYSSLINSNNFGKLLIELKENRLFLSMINMTINQQDLLEIILNLEFERIASKSTKSFLLIIKSISKDLQNYLIKHLQQHINDTKQEYVMTIIKHLIEISTNDTIEDKLLSYILSLIEQKTILKSFYYSIFLYNNLTRQKIISRLETIICSYSTYEKELIDTVLLIYGNCFLCSENTKLNGNIMKALESIQSFRANICSTVCRDYDSITKQIENNNNKEETYKILLELTLYAFDKRPSTKKINTKEEFCNYLAKYSDELLPIFMNNLNGYLSENNEYSGITPNFVDIAMKFTEKHLFKFRNAIKRSSFGENDFRKNLGIYYQRNSNNRKNLIQLYANLCVLTDEFLNMIEEFYSENKDDQLSLKFEHVLNRNAIEKLFQLIKSNMTNKKLNIYLNILSSISHHNQISLTEIHQQLELVNNVPLDSNSEEQILNLLLECSCIKDNYIESIETKIFTENDIEQIYRSDMEDIDKNSNLFSRGYYHLRYS